MNIQTAVSNNQNEASKFWNRALKLFSLRFCFQYREFRNEWFTVLQIPLFWIEFNLINLVQLNFFSFSRKQALLHFINLQSSQCNFSRKPLHRMKNHKHMPEVLYQAFMKIKMQILSSSDIFNCILYRSQNWVVLRVMQNVDSRPSILKTTPNEKTIIGSAVTF